MAVLLLQLFVPSGCSCLFSEAEVTPPAGDEESVTEPDGPAGVSLAYLSGGDIWLLTPAEEQVKLTDYGDVEYFEWSPDGERIAYYRSGELRVINADGSGEMLVDSAVLLFNFPVVGGGYWHPGSSELAYGLQDSPVIRIKSLTGVTEDHPLSGGSLANGIWWHPHKEIMAYVTLQYIGMYNENQVTLQSRSGGSTWSMPYSLNPRWWLDGARLALVQYNIDDESGYYFCEALAYVNELGEDYTAVLSAAANDRFPLIGISASGSCLALADIDELLLFNPAGDASVLFEQDVMTTYSEFSYPIRFAWPGACERIAALLYTQTAEVPGGVKGYWDLVFTDLKTGESGTLWEKVYFIDPASADGAIPMRGVQPLFWSPDGTQLLVLQDRAGGGYDIWRVDPESGEPPYLYLKNTVHAAYQPGS